MVLIGSTGLRIRTVTRERARQAADAPDAVEGQEIEPPSGLTSAPPTDLPEPVATLPDRDG